MTGDGQGRETPASACAQPGTDADARRAPDATPIRFAQAADGLWLEWSVVEVDARAVPGTHGARCLVFSRQDCIRRVWEYPSDWRSLDPEGLAALSWRR